MSKRKQKETTWATEAMGRLSDAVDMFSTCDRYQSLAENLRRAVAVLKACEKAYVSQIGTDWGHKLPESIENAAIARAILRARESYERSCEVFERREKTEKAQKKTEGIGG